MQLHTLIFFSSDSAKEEDAFVLDVDTADKSEPVLRVIVPRYGIEGQVKIPVLADDPNLTRLPEQHKISYQAKANEFSIQVFDKIRVSIWVKQSQDYQRELMIELVSPDFDLGKKRKGDSATNITGEKTRRSKKSKCD